MRSSRRPARGDDAVELVERLRPDVAILDIKMPGLDGIEAARRIHEGRSAAVLLLTAFSQRDLVEQARDAGAQAYLVKPFQRASSCPRSSWRSPATVSASRWRTRCSSSRPDSKPAR